jgi:hypothetical protein
MFSGIKIAMKTPKKGEENPFMSNQQTAEEFEDYDERMKNID